MVAIRSVAEADLEDFRRLHNQYVDRDEPLETVHDWYGEHPDLLVGAYRDGELVGYCLGVPLDQKTVELGGIAVKPPHQRQDIGTDLLAAIEDRAANLGFQRVTVGSAGGYVDEFYLQNVYTPTNILVRLDLEDVPENYRDMGYDIAEETVDEGTKKLYIDVTEFDPGKLERIRDAFDDPHAIYIMEKRLEASS